MIKVKDFNDIKPDDKLTITSSYKGYVSYVTELNKFVGMSATVIRKSNENDSIEITILNNRGYHDVWWYPLYALKFEGDNNPITLETIKIGRHYKMMCDNLKPFEIYRYQNDVLDYDNEPGYDIISNIVRNRKLTKGTTVKVLQLINVRPEFNDIIVLCETQDNKKHYLPLTSLYDILPSLTPKKFVYEFNQWKDS